MEPPREAGVVPTIGRPFFDTNAAKPQEQP